MIPVRNPFQQLPAEPSGVQFNPDVPLDTDQIRDWRGANNPWLGWLEDMQRFGMQYTQPGRFPIDPPYFDPVANSHPAQIGYPWGRAWDIMNNPVRPNTWGAFTNNPLNPFR